MVTTLLNEQGWGRDAIERQLAHGERDEVRAAYNYAEYLPERRKMMQAWADYLDRLRAGRRVSATSPARRTLGGVASNEVEEWIESRPATAIAERMIVTRVSRR